MYSLVQRFNNFTAITRLIFCLGISLLALALFLFFRLNVLTSAMLAWDSFCLLMILLSWLTFFTVQQKELRLQARKQDESRSMTFVLVIFSICISLVGTIILLKSNDESLVLKSLHTAVCILGVSLSWMLLHTIFTLRYAHLYYAGSKTDEQKNSGGLDFPEEDEPDYLDFAYFAFVVGMTFQVSDVAVTTRSIRRVVLLHGLISFVFNTAIVALSINIISNLGK